MKIDWVADFDNKFNSNQLIASLKQTKFHGKIEINFADGVPNTCHLNWCIKPYGTFTLDNGVTLTKGGSNE